MGLVVIPADYEECSSSVVPIYIRTEDDLGNRINDGWIHAAARAAGYIRSFARYFLSDEWRASELADETVQDLDDDAPLLFGDGRNRAAADGRRNLLKRENRHRVSPLR